MGEHAGFLFCGKETSDLTFELPPLGILEWASQDLVLI